MSDRDLRLALLEAEKDDTKLAALAIQIIRTGIDPVQLALALLRRPEAPWEVRLLDLNAAAAHNAWHIRDAPGMRCGAKGEEPSEANPGGVGLVHGGWAHATCILCLRLEAQALDELAYGGRRDPMLQLMRIQNLRTQMGFTRQCARHGPDRCTNDATDGHFCSEHRTCEHVASDGHRSCTQPRFGVLLLCAGHAAVANGSRDPELVCADCRHAWVDHHEDGGCMSGWSGDDETPNGCACPRFRHLAPA